MSIEITVIIMDDCSTKIKLLGVTVDNLSMSETIAQIEGMISSGSFSYVVTPNVDHLIKLQKDRVFQSIYQGASLAVPDGVPLLWAARILGTPLKERVNGTDLFVKLCEVAALKGYSIYLLGGDTGVAERASKLLQEKYSGLKVAGYYCPEFGFDSDLTECQRIQQKIAASQADMLFVGLGAPKQERWIAKFGAGCKVGVAIGIGVSFSFIAGDIKRAPIWMQKRGLEWLWRLLAEPRRLSKRYLVDDMPFLWLVAKCWLKQTWAAGK